MKSVHTLKPPPVHQSQDVEHSGDVWMVMPRCLLQVLQGLLAQRHSHLVPPLRGVLDHQVVQRPEARRDLVASLLGCHLSTGLGCDTKHSMVENNQNYLLEVFKALHEVLK